MSRGIEHGAIFDTQEVEYVEGVWWVGCPERDLMGMVWKGKDGEWKGRYRWREYDVATLHKDPFNDKDQKTVTDVSLKPGDPPKKLIDAMHLIFMKVDKMLQMFVGRTQFYYLPVKGDVDKLAEVITAAPFTHVKKVFKH